jgi:hypothetical protein
MPRILLSPCLFVGLLLAGCVAQPVPSEGEHALKEPAYGSAEIFTLEKAGPLPLDKRFDQLSPEQIGILRSWYKDLGPDDEPPFPEQG